MKKAIRFTTGLSLQILLLGLIGFFGTFLSDHLDSIGWFGDETKDYMRGGVMHVEWGARHLWYVWTLVAIVLTQIARMVMWSVAFWDEEAKKILS